MDKEHKKTKPPNGGIRLLADSCVVVLRNYRDNSILVVSEGTLHSVPKRNCILKGTRSVSSGFPMGATVNFNCKQFVSHVIYEIKNTNEKTPRKGGELDQNRSSLNKLTITKDGRPMAHIQGVVQLQTTKCLIGGTKAIRMSAIVQPRATPKRTAEVLRLVLLNMV